MSDSHNPMISIVTPSFNQGSFIRDAIESVAGQNYPYFEHIIIDGESTDNTHSILAEYDHLKVIAEPDEGHADALNKGFALSSGEILTFLNSDDRLEPGALAVVAQGMDPEREIQVVMGRCRFIDERGRYTGIEHPSYYGGRLRMLAIWKGHGIPQPSVFWTRQVWERCGPMNEDLPFAWIDYDFFCRVSKHYNFHPLDHVLSSYRLHSTSKTESIDEDTRLQQSISISRRYWGPAWSLDRWRLQTSLWLHRLNRKARGHSILRRSREAWNHRQMPSALIWAMVGGLLAPDVAFRNVIYPPIRDQILSRISERLSSTSKRKTTLQPETRAMLEFNEVWADGWVGPLLRQPVKLAADTGALVVRGWTDITALSGPLQLVIKLEDHIERKVTIDQTGDFDISIPLPERRSDFEIHISITANRYFVPDHLHQSGDLRPLSWKLYEIGFVRGEN